MRDLLPIDEFECRDIFIAVGNFSELVLEVADVRLEVVVLSHFDGEKVVVILLAYRREAYCVRNVSITFSKLWSERGDRE